MKAFKYTIRYAARGAAFCAVACTLFFLMLLGIYLIAGDTPRDSGVDAAGRVDWQLERRR